jgi:hypothetical protein
MDEGLKKRALKNGRSSNSFCCAFCHQFHQSRKRGRCKYITGSLTGLVEFVKRYDTNERTSFVRQGIAFETENALRRIVAFATENKAHFQEWASKSAAEFPLEHHVAPLVPTEDPSAPPEEALTVPAAVATAADADDDDDGALKPAEPRKGPPPPQLTYEFLKSRAPVQL